MLLLIAHSAVGLIPVIIAEALSYRRGISRGMWVAGGLTISMMTGLVYVFGLSLGRWFNHIDIAHVLMGVSFYLILRGAPASGRLELESAPRARPLPVAQYAPAHRARA